ncbi:hypothetical protein RhiirC2_769832 [Rhizophagus irregularis]|uniref:Uncharacterized protein n=1 Tax=Rhizophagus irregularis TaxID=588596 RepID=A0A2N1NY75_9GLOM|nr:hypothetical protein RhiirC2_769832 [Rhizophagus irregularis]
MIFWPGVTYLISKWDSEVTECWIYKGPFLKPAPKVVQKLEEAKHNLLEIKEWESCMEKKHSEKKEAQKRY